MPRRTRYEEIAEETIEASEKAGGTQLDFCYGLKGIILALKERMELEVDQLEDNERWRWDDK